MNAILGLFLAFQGAAFAAPIHFDDLILLKDGSPGDFGSHVSRTPDLFRQCLNTGMEFSSYQAAVDYDALQDGVYNCHGEFVQVPGRGVVQIFALTQCKPAPDLKQTCLDYGRR